MRARRRSEKRLSSFVIPSSWSRNIVSFKTYTTDDADGLRLWEAVQGALRGLVVTTLLSFATARLHIGARLITTGADLETLLGSGAGRACAERRGWSVSRTG